MYGGWANGIPRNWVTVPSVVPKTVALSSSTVGSPRSSALPNVDVPSVEGKAAKHDRRSAAISLSPMMDKVAG